MISFNNVKSPFIYTKPVIPPIFCGREVELGIINQALFYDRDNLVIYGNDAIGKSSLICTIDAYLKEQSSSKTLPVYINMSDFLRAVRSNFLGIIIHEICAAIWTIAMKKPYSELVYESLSNSNIDIIKNAEEKLLKRIYTIVTSQKLSSTRSFESILGTDLSFVKNDHSRGSEFVSERKSIEDFEFYLLLDELNDLIKSFGYESILIICDELNHYPENLNAEILRNYLTISSNKRIQFIVVVVNPNPAGPSKSDADNLINSFNYKLELGHYRNSLAVTQLLKSCLDNSKIGFENSVHEVLYELTNGHPWWIQKISDYSYIKGVEKNKDLIDEKDIEISFQKFKPEINIYNDLMRKELNFRKSYIRNFFEQ